MQSVKQYDIAVIGGGLTGYGAAVRAAQLGAKTVLIEDEVLGGSVKFPDTVPVRYLLQNAKVVRRCTLAKSKGLRFSKVSLNFEGLFDAYVEKKDKLTLVLRDSLKAYGVDICIGTGVPRSDMTIAVTRRDYHTRFLKAKTIILAGGSSADLPAQFISVPDLMTDKNAGLSGYLPKTLAICGYGPDLCEAAQVFSIFGSQVTLLVSEESLLPAFSEKMNEQVEELLSGYGVVIHKDVRFSKVYRDSAYNYHIEYKNRKETETKALVTEDIYYSGNTRANLTGLDALPLSMTGGWIETDDRFKTALPGFYAPGASLLTKANPAACARAGIIAVEDALGQNPAPFDERLIPHAVQTIPEGCRIGRSAREAIREGYTVKIGNFPMAMSDWAVMIDGEEGFVDIVSDERYGEVLGAEVFGRAALELITTVSTVMQLEGTVEDLAQIIYPYPSVTEALSEAALEAVGAPRKKKARTEQ